MFQCHTILLLFRLISIFDCVEVPTETAQQFADYHNLLFIETSAKTGLNVEKSFGDLALKIYDSLEEGKFKLQDGWDGIKSGYMRTPAVATATNRVPNIALGDNANANANNESQSSKKGCC